MVGSRPVAVIPGPRSGTRNPASLLESHWIPAFAGMTAVGTLLPVSFLGTCRSDMQNECPVSRSPVCIHHAEPNSCSGLALA